MQDKSASKTFIQAVPKEVIKRDGTKVEFEADRIFDAVSKAANASGEFGDIDSKKITNRVIKVINHRFTDSLPEVEQIQDIVQQVIIEQDYFETAKAFIAYRAKREIAREDKKTMVDVEASVNEYLSRADWRVNANANIGYSLGGLILNVSGKVTANYWLSHIFSKEAGEAHRNADFYIHDLDMLCGYCAGWSLRTLLQEGFNGVPGKVEAGPPKHLSAAVGQMVNFLGTLQNEWAGAQAFSSVDTYLAPFIRLDNMTYAEVKQKIQELIYNLNVPSRWGTQTPFTNFTFDWVCPEDLKNVHPLIGGKEVAFTYGDLTKEMGMVNKAYIEIMTTGDMKGRPFTFPIPTYNITPDFPWEGDENAEALFEMTAKYGIPYFQNFVNSALKPTDVRSMCCRLQLDLRELLKRGNGLFGSAEQTGSVGVITINCARLGYLYKGDETALFEKIDYLTNLAKDTLEVKRKTVQKFIDSGLYPYTKRYLGTLRNHFSTIGVNGVNEMIRNFTFDKEDITTPWGKSFALRFLDYIRARIVQFQEETGNLYNLEATPAEGTTYRLAKEDKKRFPDIIQAGTPDAPYYTNSSQLPVNYTADGFEALEAQEELQQKYTGGTVFHFYMSERISSATACKKIIKKAVENFRVPYITITPTFSICPKHGYIPGEHKFCPKCDAELLAKKREGKIA